MKKCTTSIKYLLIREIKEKIEIKANKLNIFELYANLYLYIFVILLNSPCQMYIYIFIYLFLFINKVEEYKIIKTKRYYNSNQSWTIKYI
jgi:hypothetical protein